MKTSETRRTLNQLNGYFVAAGLFSLAVNVLYLASPLYMLQVYDRVMTSGSLVTLVMLTVALLVALAALAGLDAVRARVLTRASVRLDRLLASRVIEASVRQPENKGRPLRDLDAFRQALTGSGIQAAFDLPWAPIYVLIIFLLHPALGFFALGACAILIFLALANEWMTREPLREASEAAARNYGFTEASLRNAEVLDSMGMMRGLLGRWSHDRLRLLDRQAVASDRSATMSSLIRFVRLAMQSLVLGLGAYLALERMTSIGSLFAATLLLGRALQPVEQVVAAWRSLVAAQASYVRVRDMLDAMPQRSAAMSLPRPSGLLSVEALSFVPPNTPRVALRNVSFRLEPGDAMGLIGPSGAGKSTLVRHIVGVLRPTSGAVRLDGADVLTWPREQLGQHVGYLPQDIELFADTVAANIGRLRTDADADAEIVKAAQLAGVHEMILRLPEGYNTQIGEGGSVLSGGYRQRIALARAVFGVPSLVVLDEPSSNLDSDGDTALAECLMRLRELGATVIIVSHRPSTLGAVDKILYLREGMIELFGMRDEVVAALNDRAKNAVVTRAAQVPA
jgi:ATP-binding cassette, subfamily C, bacterial